MHPPRTGRMGGARGEQCCTAHARRAADDCHVAEAPFVLGMTAR